MKGSSEGEWFDDFFAGFTAYYLTSLPVLLGALFALSFLRPSVPGEDLVSVCFRSDALHYRRILWAGYSYDPAKRSTVAFFPAYPLLSRGMRYVMRLPPEEAALLTAHAALLGAFVMMARYARVRWPEATTEQRGVVLAVFGLWPTGLFFRMPYAESLFVCVTLAVLYGMARGWPLITLALLAGFATATRPVGVALTVAILCEVLMRPALTSRKKVGAIFLLTPVACWGLIAYMGFQWLAFGTPWAFAQTQEHWTKLVPQDRGWLTKAMSLATLEPIWSVYVPSSQRFWMRAHDSGGPLFGLTFWNPIFFVLAAILLALGGWKRWLTISELILSASLLAIPYLTRSYEMSMASHGRFAAVIVVDYLVIGRIMARLPRLAATVVCTLLALFIFIFTFLYSLNASVF